jgi:CubicO group peptidase (beta-lactamase class C family)
MIFRIVAILAIATSVQAQQKDPAAAFDAYTTQAFKDWGAVGLAVAVVKDGKVVFAKGYGVQELGKPAAVDTNTRFSIGSTTSLGRSRSARAWHLLSVTRWEAIA